MSSDDSIPYGHIIVCKFPAPHLWKIASVDARQGLVKSSSSSGPVICSYSAFQLVSLISTPVCLEGFEDAAAAVVDANATPPSPYTQLSRLVDLLLEILSLICSHLNVVDLVRVIISQPDLCVRLVPSLRKALVNELAPWTGHRLICISMHARGQLPAELLTEDERALVEDESDASHDEAEGKKNLYDFIQNKRPPFCTPWSPSDFSDEDLQQLPVPIRTLVRSLMTTKDLFDKSSLCELFPNDQEWVLRNLTTREYARANVLCDGWHPLRDNRKLRSTHMKPYQGLGEALLARIWRSIRSDLPDYTSTLTHSKWAGHRFEICTMSRHERLSQGWTDVSDELAGETSALVN